jgi:hypothetical protein
MSLLLHIRDGGSDGESDGRSDDEFDDIPESEPYETKPPPTSRLRCYACAGRGKLWVTDEHWPRGRYARCIACLGSGHVTIPHGPG